MEAFVSVRDRASLDQRKLKAQKYEARSSPNGLDGLGPAVSQQMRQIRFCLLLFVAAVASSRSKRSPPSLSLVVVLRTS